MKRATTVKSHENVLALIALIVLFLLGSIARGDTQAELVRVMQENFEACNYEDLPRLLETMAEEMPNRNMFIIQCKREWRDNDLYYRLDGIRIVKQNKWRPPYVVATVTQTITENQALNHKPGFHGDDANRADPKLSHMMSLNTDQPTTEYEVLFKKEGGEFKVVAGLTEPRPIGAKPKEMAVKGDCANGQCKLSWPRSARE